MKKKRQSNSEASNTPVTSNTRSKYSPHLKVRLNFSNANKAASVRKRRKTALRQAYRKIEDLKVTTQKLTKQKNAYAKRLERL